MVVPVPNASRNKIFKVIFFLGPPGSGKGALTNYLSKEFGIPTMSAGDLLRRESSNDASEYGPLIKKICLAGDIVPAKITINLLLNEMEHKFKTQNNSTFFVDGF